jgi:outer membrane protein assembly factor BamD
MLKSLFRTLLVLILPIVVLTSCAHKKQEETAEMAYKKAMEYFLESSYDFAAQQFEKIDDDFPFTPYATKGQVMAAYAYYKAQSYEDSLRVIDYFISMNSGNPNLEYMYYLRAIDYYVQVKSYKKSFDIARLARTALNEVIFRFPNGKYTEDSKKKLDDVNNNIAASEMYVGRFYLNNKNYVGAIAKFDIVASTPEYEKFHPEAYYRLVEVYHIIGLENAAKKSYDVLKNKYSDTRWFEYGQKIVKDND